MVLDVVNGIKWKWTLWFKDLFTVSSLQIPRCYNLSELDVVERELHVFSNTSVSAYATCAYWRFVDSNSEVKLALICSRARVAPLKPVSIPCLELQGAVMAARLATSICLNFKYFINSPPFCARVVYRDGECRINEYLHILSLVFKCINESIEDYSE